VTSSWFFIREHCQSFGCVGVDVELSKGQNLDAKQQKKRKEV